MKEALSLTSHQVERITEILKEYGKLGVNLASEVACHQVTEAILEVLPPNPREAGGSGSDITDYETTNNGGITWQRN